LIPTVLAVATALPGLHAFAAETERALEETVVTANYRPTALGATAGSVTVLGAALIEERAARHLQDILNAAPNVTFSAGSSRGRFIQVRGIGDLEQYYDPKFYPSVGLMLDELELGDSANAGMLVDVAQVEVLRGPQGTRFGSSAHAGMVQIRSNRPGDEFAGEISGGIGDYDSYHAGLVLSGPLGDSLLGRVAVQENASDGYIENDRLDRDDVNELDEFTTRARLVFEPTATASYELSALYFDADNGHDAWSLDNNRHTQTDQPGADRQETFAATLSGSWELGGQLALSATLSRIDSDLKQSYDADWVSDELCLATPCSGGNDTAREIFERDRERTIFDLRLLGGSELNAGDSRYVLGLYANDGKEDFDYAFPSFWFGDYASTSQYETQRVALYGEYEYGISDNLSALVGVRAERFEDDYSNNEGFASDNSDDLLNFEASLRYSLGDNSMVYITVAQGNKPGGVNTTASANESFMSPPFQDFIRGKLTFDDEELTNKEIGLRTQQLDGRVKLSIALFHTDRKNAQLENWMWDADSGLWVGFLDTTGDAESYGIELESTFALHERLELFANLGWLETEVDSIETFDLDQNAFVTKNNREQAKSPEYQYHVGARFALTDNLSGRVELEGQDDTFFGYYHDGQLDGYDLVNGSLTWAQDAFAITLWGRNLTDEDYAVHGLYFAVDPRDDFGAWANRTYEQLGEPRTWGVDVSYAF
ncbi:MAG: TonB-dependent receptor, partial [Halioglobus sp.]|nr:TonB-dependent receptor [Halioglobus sp.]